MTAETDRPIPESYWVLPGRLLAGEYPGQYQEEATRRRLEALVEAGFDMFIDLTWDHENVPYAGTLRQTGRLYQVNVTHHRFPIGDFGLPSPEQMNRILDTIDQGLQEGRKIYLHCWGGIGRTGTTVGCYLVRHGKTGTEALDELAAWWQAVPKSRFHPRSPETSQQRDFVLHWGEHDRQVPGLCNIA
jgi:hypothetical protein